MSNWIWIPITLWAAFAQSLRNAAQRHLIRDLGTLGATSVRFIYGLPFALVWLLLVRRMTGASIVLPHWNFWIWTMTAACSQIAGTWLLLRVMAQRNFVLGVAYSKTEAIQVALIAMIVFGESLSVLTLCAIMLATLGVVLVSSTTDNHPIRALALGFASRSAGLGLLAGAAFAISAVGFRNATLALEQDQYLLSAATTLVVAQVVQSTMLTIWLRKFEPQVLRRVIRSWRGSFGAGFMGAAATAGWFTAMAIAPVAQVRTLGLSELLFSLLVSQRVFREHLRRIEWIGLCLLGAGLVLVVYAP